MSKSNGYSCTLQCHHLPRMAILKPSRLRTRPDVNPIYVRRLQPNPQFDDRLNNFTSAILHFILRQ